MEQSPAPAPAHAKETAADTATRAHDDGADVLAEGRWLLGAASPPTVRAAGALGLQRLAGNAAASRLLRAGEAPGTVGTARLHDRTVQPPAALQRADFPVVQRQDTNPPLSATLFTVDPLTPELTGTVTTRPSAKLRGAVDIVGPKIKLSTTVTLDHPDNLAQGISVGYVQTLMESRRQGVYGVKGKEAMRYTTSTPRTRDVEPQVNASGKAVGAIQSGERALPPPPFFSWPQTLGVSKESVTLSFVDIPSFPLYPREGDTVLQGSDGIERFVLSVAAKDTTTGKVVHLGGSIAWEFSWRQTIDSSGTGHGGQGITWATSPTGAPIMTDGRTAHSGGHSWWDFPSVAAAAAAPTSTLLENLGLTAAAGPVSEPSRTHTIAALKAHNPHFQVQVSTDNTAAWVGKDSVRVTVHGDQPVHRDTVVHEDAPNWINFRLLDVFSDPAAITGPSALLFTLNVTSEWTGSPGTVSFPLPFTGLRAGKQVAAHGGNYRISGNF